MRQPQLPCLCLREDRSEGSATWCCTDQIGNRVGAGWSDTECFQKNFSNASPCRNNPGGSRCGSPSSDCGGCGAQFCCEGICGAGPACFARASCCADMCGVDGPVAGDGILCDGVCTDGKHDMENCGACGRRCRPGTSFCNEGVCECSKTIDDECDGYDDDCDGQVDEEATCSAPNVCSAGSCRCAPQNSCPAGCVDTLTHVGNCGGCGQACATSPPHARSFCKNGACALICERGFGDCDGVIGNGCEKSLADDSASCGACARACNGVACVDGGCVLGNNDLHALSTEPPLLTATHAYWVAGAGVVRAPLSGGASQLVGPSNAYLTGLTSGGGFIYWLQPDEHARPPKRLMRSSGTGTPVAVRSAPDGGGLYMLAADDTAVYFYESVPGASRLMRSPHLGTAAALSGLAPNEYPDDLEASTGQLFLLTTAPFGVKSVRRMPATGGPATTLVTPVSIDDLTVSASHVMGRQQHGLTSFDRNGAQLTTWPAPNIASPPTMFGSRAWWSRHEGDIVSSTLDGGDVRPWTPTDFAPRGRVSAPAFTTSGVGYFTTPGVLWSAPAAGGAPTALAVAGVGGRLLLVTSDSVYFVSGGQLFRVPRAGGPSTRLRNYPASLGEWPATRPVLLGGALYQLAEGPYNRELIARVPLDGGPMTNVFSRAVGAPVVSGNKLFAAITDGGEAQVVEHDPAAGTNRSRLSLPGIFDTRSAGLFAAYGRVFVAAAGKMYRLEPDGGVVQSTASGDEYVTYRDALYRFWQRNTVPAFPSHCRVELDGACDEVTVAADRFIGAGVDDNYVYAKSTTGSPQLVAVPRSVSGGFSSAGEHIDLGAMFGATQIADLMFEGDEVFVLLTNNYQRSLVRLPRPQN